MCWGGAMTVCWRLVGAQPCTFQTAGGAVGGVGAVRVVVARRPTLSKSATSRASLPDSRAPAAASPAEAATLGMSI